MNLSESRLPVRSNRSCRLVAAVSIAMSMEATTPVSAQCEFGAGSWNVGIGQRAAGPLGTVSAAMGWDPDGAGPQNTVLIAAGAFTVAGSTQVNNIATWDGTQWSPLGSGFNGGVGALAMYNGELIAGGSFTASGGIACNGVARWNGSSWQPLGAGITGGSVTCMAVYNNRLYVGGFFTSAGGAPANRIASWDGGIWRTVGVGGSNGGGGVEGGWVYAMVEFDNALVVGGDFDSALGVANTVALARWNGASWSSMGLVLDNDSFSWPAVRAMAVWASSTQFNTWTLYVGGDFDTINGVAADNVARYPVEGLASGPWAQAGAGVPTVVHKLLVQNSGPVFHSVYASSQAGSAGTTWPGGIYRLSSGVWNQFAPEQATCFALYGGLIAGVKGLSKHNGTQWTALGDGLNGAIASMHSQSGEMIAFGDFSIADQQNVGGAARLDATGWHPFLGPILGPSSTGPLNSVTDAAIHAGQFFVAGRLRDGNNNDSYRVFRWNGLTWVATLFAASNGAQPRFAILNSSLYVTVHNYVYRWNGATWSQQGPEMPGFASARGVLWWNGALHAYGDDLLRLDGASWTVVGDNPSWMLNDGIVWNGRLFMVTSTQGPSTIVELIGDDLVTIVDDFWAREFVEFNGRLFALAGSGIMEFDGTDWFHIASIFGGPSHLKVVNGSLTAFGNIAMINTTISPLFARLNCCTADVTGDGQVSVSDLLAVINGWGMCSNCPATNCAPDVAPLPDGDCAVNVIDLLDIINHWGPCP